MANVKVAVRVRPLSKRESAEGGRIAVQVDEKVVRITNIKLDGKLDGPGDSREKLMGFGFDYCYWSVDPNDPNYSSQEEKNNLYSRLDMKELQKNNLYSRVDMKGLQKNNLYSRVDMKGLQKNNPYSRVDMKGLQKNNPYSRVDMKGLQKNNPNSEVEMKGLQKNNPYSRVDMKGLQIYYYIREILEVVALI
ncbi:UNVERIFIED_CONTAM: hypothetical protein FKN15_032945 [Acipenser sinensis]